MTNCRRSILFPLAFLLVCDWADAAANSRPVLKIIFPPSNAVVNNGTLIEATITPAPSRQQFFTVRFSFSTNRKEFTEITGSAPDGLAPYGVLWNTQSLPGGRYFVRVEAVPLGSATKTLVQTILLQVNEQPTAVAKAVPSGQGPFTVSFDASGSKDPDGHIASYHWDFEDGSVANGVKATHTYPGVGRYPFQLTVTDDRGGTGTADHILDLTPGPGGGPAQVLDEVKDGCGCKQMRILDGDKATGGTTVVGPDGFELRGDPTMPAGETASLGGYDGGAQNHKLDLTKGPFTVATRFEVVANLVKESQPAQCAEGQRVKRSQSDATGTAKGKEGKFSSDPRYDPSNGADPYAPAPPTGSAPPPTEGECPDSGDKWCDDDYHGGDKATGEGKVGQNPPNPNKKYDGETRIVWLDAPGPRGLSAARIKATGYLYDAKFEALVSGAGGSCKCSWEVHIAIGKDGEIHDNKVSNIACSP